MERSKRLRAVAGLVTEGAFAADIGTDHGYVPIDLVKSRRAAKAIATDIKEGPLERARLHILEQGLEGRIETRLSDGLHALSPGEVDTVILAGMGGALTIRILEERPQVTGRLKELVLQPQSEIRRVREYLVTHGYRIVEEDMVEEDGKFYPMMKARHEADCAGETPVYEEWEYLYGKELLKNRHPALGKYLFREKGMKEKILRRLLEHEDSTRAQARKKEILRGKKLVERALEEFAQGKREMSHEMQ